MKNVESRRARIRQAIVMAALGLVASKCAVTAVRAAEGGFSPTALQQIQSLMAEKQARTPAQLKLDSQLIYAMKLQRGEPVAPGVPTQRLTFTWDVNGRVLVDIDARVTAQLLAQIRQDGEVVVMVRESDSVRALVPLSQLESLAVAPGVKWIKPAVKPVTRLGRTTSEGDATHRAGVARTNFAVMGAGVRVGVMSDSVNTLGSLDRSVAAGEVTPVTIIPGQSGNFLFGSSDEGTAMLEIVADLAPKAELFFATAFNGEANFAANVRKLFDAGCDIIVDDVGYPSESPFQDDEIAQAVNFVTANGAMYFSAAANSGNINDGTSCTWEGDFTDDGMVTLGSSTGQAHRFGNNRLNRITLEPIAFSDDVSFWWSDPIGRATNDYDLFILDATGANVLASSTNPQNGNQDPWEYAGPALDSNQIAILKIRGADRFFHVELFRGMGTLAVATDGNTHGHSSATNAFSVAAVPARPTFPNSFGPANKVETFSSDGLRRMYYDAQGNQLTPATNFLSTGGVVRQKPDIAAADGVTTTVAGFAPFFGTSAAAPHAAAIAALIKSYNLALTPQQIRSALTNTAIDIEAPGFDRDSGVGIVMPDPALGSLPPPLPTLVSSNLSGGNGNGVIDFNECNELDLVLQNNAPTVAAAVSATLVTFTPGVTVVVGTAPYPSILPGGTAVNTIPFRIYTSPSFVCGTPIDLSLRISSSLGASTNNFRMPSGLLGAVPAKFQATNVVATIPDGDTNGVNVLIPVSGLAFPIGKVTVDLHIAHEATGDLVVDLFSPDNRRVILTGALGGTNANYGLSCTEPTIFDDAAPTNILSGFSPFVGTFRPLQPLSSFGGKLGTNANGVWRLRVRDFITVYTGSVQCVTLSIFPALCTEGGGDCTADLGVTATDDPDPVLVGSNLTYTIVVTNRTPRLAPVTTMIDTLPPGVTVVGVTTSRGSCSVSAGSVDCSLGTLPGNGSATIRIVAKPSAAGLITNRVAVSSLAMDTNPLDNNAVVVTTVQNPTPVIVPFATSLVAESGPITGGLEPGETVTVNFYLRNVGTLNTTNLIAKLLPTGGVKDPSDQQNYGELVPFGAAVARPFVFEAVGTNGGLITATFQLWEGETNIGAQLGFVSFSLGIGGGGTFVNQSVIGIPFNGPATLYPSSVLVSGVAGVVNGLTVTLSNVNHSFPADIDVLLVGPSGQKVVLMSDAGASIGMSNAVLRFDDAAPLLLPQEGPIVSGTYHPTDYTDLPPADVDPFPLPAPAGPYATALAAFNGQGANGLWSLYVLDDFAGDNGRISGGWHLAFSTIDPLNPNVDLAVSIVDSPDPVMLGSNVTYTVSVTNGGPEVALDVLLTTTLPAGMSFVSVAAQQGSCSNSVSGVICNLGNILRTNTVAVTIVATANGIGTHTVTAQAAGSVVDFNPANNTAVETTFIRVNADLSVAMVTTPPVATVNDPLTYTLTIRNLGPNDANGVLVTNSLPPGLVFLGFNASQGVCSEFGGVVTCSLGSIPNGAQASVVVVVTAPPGVGLLTATAGVGAISPPDPDLSNNQVTLTTSNINPSYIIVPAMAFLVSESGPITGGIDPGETNTINFELRNVGTQPTATLVGELLAGGGVVPITASRTYGVLHPMGAAAGATFTFVAEGTNGGLITATLQLRDGPLDLGRVSFNFALGNIVRYDAPATVDVPEVGPVGLYPSTLTVSGLTGQVSKVTVTLSNLSHTYPDDLDILLVSPNNRFAMLMSDAGGGNGLTDVTLSFDDSATNALPDRFAIQSGAYRPTDYDVVDLLPPPAPPGPYSDYALDVFNGIDPNGTWSLFIYDDSFSDEGRLAGGWSIEITTVDVIDPQPSLLVAGRVNAAGRFEMTLKGHAGGKYLIQSSPDMRSWTTIGNAVLAPSNTLLFSDPEPAGLAPRFYRAIHIP